MDEPWSQDAWALADSLPDGVVVADAHGRVTLVSRTAAAMLSVSGRDSVGQPLSEVLALRDQDGADWHAINRPYDGLRTRSAIPEQSWILPSGSEVLVTTRIARAAVSEPIDHVVPALSSQVVIQEVAARGSTATGPTWSPPWPTSSARR